MLCKLQSGGLVKIRVDMISNAGGRGRSLLQGTDGWYEGGMVWLRSLNEDHHKGMSLESVQEPFIPDFWRTGRAVAQNAGHGGGDYFQMLDWANAILKKAPCPLGIHEAMDMTIPCLISQQSIAQGAEWISVPDSREW